MAKFKFYAVCVGREGPQIYTDWEQCKANITRYPGAKHRSFNLRSKAEDWISQHLLANPGDSDSEIELVDGPSTLKLTNIPVAHQKVDSDSDIEVVAYIPASKASKQLSLPPQSASTQLRDTDVIVLSPEQEEVLKLMKNEKSVFYTGSAGTGKSVLLREIIKWFKASRKNLAITASTGIAAVNIGGTTVHSWAGIGLGLDPPKDIATKFFTNAQRFADVLKRWHQVDALIIDEISMLDGNLFDTLEYLARRIRESDLPFGGIQLILSGDFCQLPPVPSRGQQGSSKESCFTFEARSWEECVGPPIVLQKVFRQKDQHFVDMLNSMRFGHLDSSAVSAFHALSREVVYTDGIEPSELFPTRQEVDRANSTRLNKLQSEEVIYQAQDIPGTDADGNQVPWATASSLLNRLIVPKILSVKVGAQVMLVKNLFDHGLVNGSIGKIESFRTVLDAVEQGRTVGTTRSEGSGQDVSLENDPSVARLPRGRVWPVVRFSSGKTLLCIPLEFTVNNASGRADASRYQVPLILAWALSIHKSQGQTLERVKVDLQNIFEKGQAYVALSRSTKMEQLQVLNFDASKVKAHPRVLAWYAKHTAKNTTHKVSELESDLEDNIEFDDQDIEMDEMDEMDEIDNEMAMEFH